MTKIILKLSNFAKPLIRKAAKFFGKTFGILSKLIVSAAQLNKISFPKFRRTTEREYGKTRDNTDKLDTIISRQKIKPKKKDKLLQGLNSDRKHYEDLLIVLNKKIDSQEDEGVSNEVIQKELLEQRIEENKKYASLIENLDDQFSITQSTLDLLKNTASYLSSLGSSIMSTFRASIVKLSDVAKAIAVFAIMYNTLESAIIESVIALGETLIGLIGKGLSVLGSFISDTLKKAQLYITRTLYEIIGLIPGVNLSDRIEDINVQLEDIKNGVAKEKRKEEKERRKNETKFETITRLRKEAWKRKESDKSDLVAVPNEFIGQGGTMRNSYMGTKPIIAKPISPDTSTPYAIKDFARAKSEMEYSSIQNSIPTIQQTMNPVQSQGAGSPVLPPVAPIVNMTTNHITTDRVDPLIGF